MCSRTGSHSAAQVPPPLALKLVPIESMGPRWEQPWFSNCFGALKSQTSALSFVSPGSQWPPKSSPALSLPWWQDWLVCKVVRACAKSCTPSTMSNSPQVGQPCSASSPYIQKAGQTPQPDGACLILATKRPALYAFLDWMRRDRRPSPGVRTENWSTPMYTPSGRTSIRPAEVASNSDTYWIAPSVGSGSVKKRNFEKKASPE
mmetsp:Transcript_77655/g.222538  ORF Transcript_77655/g.222538 Transcript_77655/m.222538 type:complete len:204 (+) Transcript_77655:986-1597(+)